MSKALNHQGVRYGKAVGVRPTDMRRGGQIVWEWLCDCGDTFNQVAGNFVRDSNSAGCPDCAKKSLAEATGNRSRTHGMSKSKEYKCWCKIKERCTSLSCKDYSDYGGAGITMCEEWLDSFETFYNDLGPKPSDGKRYSVDRIDNSKGYFKDNCRWATDTQQSRNKGKSANNTSGITGIHWEVKMHPCGTKSTLYAVAQWKGLKGEPHKAYYSVKKYGEELAQLLAEERRDVEIRRLNLLGAGYSVNHGK